MGCLITFHILISKGYIPTFLFVVFHRCFEWLYSFVGNSEDKQSVLISTGGGGSKGAFIRSEWVLQPLITETPHLFFSWVSQ